MNSTLTPALNATAIAVIDQLLSLSYTPTLQSLFATGRVGQILVRTRDDKYLFSPFIITGANLTSLLPGPPKTTDEYLVDDMETLLAAEMEKYHGDDLTRDITRIVWEAFLGVREGKNPEIREISVTWITPQNTG